MPVERKTKQDYPVKLKLLDYISQKSVAMHKEYCRFEYALVFLCEVLDNSNLTSEA
jgi:hypothetical protein